MRGLFKNSSWVQNMISRFVLKISLRVILTMTVLSVFLFQGCAYWRTSHEDEFVKILQREKSVVQKYQNKGYLKYLKDNLSNLPQNIQEKNKHVEAMNTAYIAMDRQQKNEYVEIWRQKFTESWQAYEQEFLKLKTSFIPKDDLEKSEIQNWEAQWQTVMQETGVVSLEAPLFFVTGD